MNHHTVLLLSSAALLGACAQTSPNWESRFGDAARQAAASQVIHPEAPTKNTAQGRTDGKAAAGAMKAYADAYGYAVKEAKQPDIAIVPAGK